MLQSAACPTDAAGTADRLERGEPLRAGLADGHDESGEDRAIIEGLADAMGTEVFWVRDSEHELVEHLEHFELDVVAGLTPDVPWKERVGLAPYVTARGVERALAVPPGENRWLSFVEHFLDERGSKP